MAQRQKIAFQGEYGAFSEQAALAFFGKGCTPVPREGFRDVFQDVLTKKVRAGIVPVENSLFGSVHQNFDLLQEFKLSIVGEVKLRIRMNLMALPGTALRSVRNVYSHPQALGQSDRFLRSLKDVTLHQFYDTAGAAKMIAEQRLDGAAAIASLQAAEHYGLHVLKKGIETDRQNFTRFVVLSRTPVRPNGAAKTSLIFSTKHIPGSLVQCLSHFADRGVSLLKIESRPIVGRPWEYLFFVDVAGSAADHRLAAALKELRHHTSSLKILGSYNIGKVVR